jgi:hypothetical protein
MATKKPTAVTPEEKASQVTPSGGLKMDPESVRMRHEQRKNWFLGEAARQAANRALMARSESFYDGEQWKHEDAQELRARGQRPVVYNEVKPTIDWLIGTERQTRVDFIVVAEEPGDEASEDATAKTKLMKWLDATNRAGFERSQAADDAFKAGLGWIEVGLRGDKNGPPIYIGAESWRNIIYDSRATKADMSDARFIFRIKVVDLDVALACFPDKEQEIRSCMQEGEDARLFHDWLIGSGLISSLDDFATGSNNELDYLMDSPVDLFNGRPRVLLMECWSRIPVPNKEPNRYGIADPITWKVMCSIMTEKDTLVEAMSPFRHDRFPFIPVWAYRNKRTGLPYGPIWQMIGPQESLNHRMARALFEASSNQIKLEVGTWDKEVMDLHELREELNDPNGMAVFAAGALSGGKVQEREHQSAAIQQTNLASLDIQSLRQMSGVTGENRGLDTNATSGRAVLAKQDQGTRLTTELFDNLLLARQMEGEMVLSLAEQFITMPVTVITEDDKNTQQYTTLNQWDEASGQYVNDITTRQARFKVGEQAWKQTLAEAAFDSMMQVFTQLAAAAPQVVLNILDVLFEMHPNLPKKAVILERIRAINGQAPLDGKLSPEQQADRRRKQAQAQAQFELQMAQMKAAVKEAQANGEKLEAETWAARLDALYQSAQAAATLMAMPQAMPVADELLRSAGFRDMAAPQVIDAQQPAQPMPPAETVPPTDPAGVPA